MESKELTNNESFQNRPDELDKLHSSPKRLGNEGILSAKTNRAIRIALSSLFFLGTGCDTKGCTEQEQQPPKISIKKAEKDLVKLLRKFMRQEFNVQIPANITLILTNSEEEYRQITKDNYATGLHSSGLYVDKTIVLDSFISDSLRSFLTNKNQTNRKKQISCDSMQAISTIIHEFAHALTKDIDSDSPFFSNFTPNMTEALATEVGESTPQFIDMADPGTSIPTDCTKWGASTVSVQNQRYTVEQERGGYINEVIFEKYLLSLTGECQSEIEQNQSWARCALRLLMKSRMDRIIAGKALNSITRNNPACNNNTTRPRIDTAIKSGNAPELQYAISQCDGGVKIPNIACSSIQVRNSNQPNTVIFDHLTIPISNIDGIPFGKNIYLKNIKDGKIYNLAKPLNFKEWMLPTSLTLPKYVTSFERPYIATNPCTLTFLQTFYCNKFQLDNFPTDRTYISLRAFGKEYHKGSHDNGEIVNIPVTEGAKIYTKLGLSPEPLLKDGICHIFPPNH